MAFIPDSIIEGQIETLFVKAIKIGLECIKLREYRVNL